MDVVAQRRLVDAMLPGPTWAPWRAALAALYALPPQPGEVELYRACTGRQHWPSAPTREAWFIVGRRGGKSVVATRVAVIAAFFRDYRQYLAPGEVGVCSIIASDRQQARIDYRYVAGVVDGMPMLTKHVISRTQDRMELDNGCAFEVTTCSVSAPRGGTRVMCIGEETAFWRDDAGANPDVEVLNAVRPSMATIPNGLLMCISTPYARRGALWTAHRDHFGKDDDPVLVWQAPSRTMNPSLSRSVVDAALQADEASARAEYLAEFRSDSEAFITRETISALVVPGRRELQAVAA